jgi:phage baseplate assembly protein W
MAYNARKIAPTDFKPGTGVGVSLPFSAPGCFSSTYTNKDATKANLINYFLTEPGSRCGNPEFGGGLGKFIFEQINSDNLDFLKEDVSSKLDLYFPEIEITNLEVSAIPDRNQINVVLDYKISQTNDTDTIEITLS